MKINKLEDVIDTNKFSVIGTDRTLPLSQCGLINTITFGIKGMSPSEVEFMKQSYIIQHEKSNELLQKTFYFFTEYFVYDEHSNKTTIDIKLI